MPRKDKIAILRDDDFAEVEEALSSAMDQLDNANTRIEALLAEQALVEDTPSEVDQNASGPSSEAAPATPASENA